ncbi:hypothetical protein BYT27DRAFT_6828111 [Phlegmacium glaucopus]|nr:hypothetical protein BYT27DRAFT_6828111 [Phlegmacium glaucopus]
MKFSKHLQNVETPEWKRVYIDYRGLKKLMNAVQTSRKQLDVHSSGSAAVLAQNYSPIAEPGTSEADSYSNDHSLKWFELPPFNFSAVNLSIWPVHEPGLERTLPSSIPSADPNAQKTLMRTPSFDTNNSEQASSRLRRDYKEQCLITPSTELLSRELLTQFTPQDFAFFAMLDAQLDKVESFYLAREKEMVARGALLLNQLEELKEHRKIFLEAGTTKKHWATGFVSTLRSRIRPQMNPSKRDEEEMTLNIVGYSSSINSRSSESFSSSSFMAALMNWSGKRKDSEGSSWTSHSAQGHWEEGVWNSTKSERPHLTTRSDDPAGYIDAERKLRRAVLEHYRLVCA